MFESVVCEDVDEKVATGVRGNENAGDSHKAVKKLFGDKGGELEAGDDEDGKLQHDEDRCQEENCASRFKGLLSRSRPLEAADGAFADKNADHGNGGEQDNDDGQYRLVDEVDVGLEVAEWCVLDEEVEEANNLIVRAHDTVSLEDANRGESIRQEDDEDEVELDFGRLAVVFSTRAHRPNDGFASRGGDETDTPVSNAQQRIDV